MIQLPENWDTFDENMKKNWLIRYTADFTREGEVSGVRDDMPQVIKDAWNEVFHG